MKKIDWKQIRIKSRKDWVIFWIFSGLICYGLGACYGSRNSAWLFQFANPYMTSLNQPYTWGQLLGALLLFAVVMEVVLFLCKKSVKARVLVLILALCIPMLIAAGYRIHSNLIVSSLWEKEPQGFRVFPNHSAGDMGFIETDDLTEEEKRTLLELCKNMTIVSDEKTQEELLQWYRQAENPCVGADDIQLWYEEKYGHGYYFNLKLYEGKVYLWRGYGAGQSEYITFFEDNGITEWLEEVIAARR